MTQESFIDNFTKIFIGDLDVKMKFTFDMFDFDNEGELSTEDPKVYYTQPHEIDAQVYGFKRLSKLRNEPFEKTVRHWFNTHEMIHQMDKKDTEFVINKILDYYREN